MGWILFATHEGDSEIGDAVLEALGSGDEGVVFCDAAIEHTTGWIVVVRIFWASAKFGPKE
jgi:hypothetical protein